MQASGLEESKLQVMYEDKNNFPKLLFRVKILQNMPGNVV